MHQFKRIYHYYGIINNNLSSCGQYWFLKMNSNVDSQLIKNIVDSLRSSDSDSILSTLEFLGTVVIFDFPAKALFYQRDLFTVIIFHWVIFFHSVIHGYLSQHLLKLCGGSQADIRAIAVSCIEMMCCNVITQHKRESQLQWMEINKVGLLNNFLQFKIMSLFFMNRWFPILILKMKPI